MIEAYLSDWAHLLLRWAHVVVGAAWIGASFYFNWLNNNVRAEADGDERLAGGLWAVHGGAFYRVMKFKGAPEELPETLHWFKYEAYFTWITGVGLLTVVYWLNARTMLIDPAVAELSEGAAVGIGVGTLVLGWIGYDLLCKSPLKDKPVALAAVGGAALMAVAYALTHLLSGRAAFMHVGALIGTCMAANVFFVIIPGQKDMVDAMVAGRPPPLERGKAGSLRSLHNNYLTLPVLFVMVSNHFPMTFGNSFNWLVLAALFVGSAGIRHWQNLHGKGQRNVWILPVATALLFGLVFVLKPTPPAAVMSADGTASTVDYLEVQELVRTHCVGCHAERPTHVSFPEAPLGVMLDTPTRVQAQADKIYTQVVVAKAMPLGNLTGMTEEERAIIGAWVGAGAPVD